MDTSFQGKKSFPTFCFTFRLRIFVLMGSKFTIYTISSVHLRVAAAGFMRVLTNQFDLGDAFLKSSKDFIL